MQSNMHQKRPLDAQNAQPIPMPEGGRSERPKAVQTPAHYHAGVRSGYAPDQPMSVIIVQTGRGAGHCPGPVVGGLRGGPSPSGDIFVAGQNIIINQQLLHIILEILKI